MTSNGDNAVHKKYQNDKLPSPMFNSVLYETGLTLKLPIQWSIHLKGILGGFSLDPRLFKYAALFTELIIMIIILLIIVMTKLKLQ